MNSELEIQIRDFYAYLQSKSLPVNIQLNSKYPIQIDIRNLEILSNTNAENIAEYDAFKMSNNTQSYLYGLFFNSPIQETPLTEVVSLIKTALSKITWVSLKLSSETIHETKINIDNLFTSLQKLQLNESAITSISTSTPLILDELYVMHANNHEEEFTSLSKIITIKNKFRVSNSGLTGKNLSKILAFAINTAEIDLSFNLLQDITTTTDLTCLKLDYNKISTIKIGPSCLNLVALHLRGNMIVDLNGIDRFPNIVLIDLRDNLISEISATEPLAKLIMVNKIQLAGNPLAKLVFTFFILN